MHRHLSCIALVAGALLVQPVPAEAAESYDNCTGFIDSLPATITSQGTWCLRKNVSTGMTSGNAITIATNNVTIDCNGFKVGGLAAGPGTSASGIYASSRFNATVRNCSIRGFYRGIHLRGTGGGHMVEGNSFDGNTFTGINVSSAPGSTIRNNQVIDTGGSTTNTASPIGIFASVGVDIIDNTVNGVAPSFANTGAHGVMTAANTWGSVVGNRIRGLAPTGSGAAYGINDISSGRTVILENIVQGPGPGVTGGVGVHCVDNQATARHNVVLGFETAVENCYLSGNTTNPY